MSAEASTSHSPIEEDPSLPLASTSASEDDDETQPQVVEEEDSDCPRCDPAKLLKKKDKVPEDDASDADVEWISCEACEFYPRSGVRHLLMDLSFR